MDNESLAKQRLNKTRLIGKKLFGRDKKTSNNDDDLSAFLHAPSDKLLMTGTAPVNPTVSLPRIDTSKASRWPTLAEVQQTERRSPERSARALNDYTRDGSLANFGPSKGNRKGLTVRFMDQKPDVIGEGGDEAEAPTMQILALRNRAMSHPLQSSQAPKSVTQTYATGPMRPRGFTDGNGEIRPMPLRRTQTGASSAEPRMPADLSESLRRHESREAHRAAASRGLEPEPSNLSSFEAKVQAERRASAGNLLAGNLAGPAVSPRPVFADVKSNPPPLSIQTDSPSTQNTSSLATPGSTHILQTNLKRDGSETSSPASVISPILERSRASGSGDDALDEFQLRTAHWFKLFSLSAESITLVSSTSFEDWVQAAAWWFLRGKTSLESIAKDPSPPVLVLQQAHADLAKSLWIIQEVLPQHPKLEASAQNSNSSDMVDVAEPYKAIISNLRKLTTSMKRNNLWPPSPEDAPLPQGLDPSIWIQYPFFPLDVLALLSGGPQSSLRSYDPQSHSTPISKTLTSETLALGDTQQTFNYARIFVDVIVMEQLPQSQQLTCPCMLSIQRPKGDKNIALLISSQNNYIKLHVQSYPAVGPTWNDIKWHSKAYAFDIKLPRGFIARVKCSPSDFNTLVSMYDYSCKIHANLRPFQDEALVFEKTVKALRLFDKNPQSRRFPKESVPECLVRVFENTATEVSKMGLGRKHRGFRLAVMTNPSTRMLSGLCQDLTTDVPLQFGFMRGDGGDPALLLKFEDDSHNSTIVITFTNSQDRAMLHSCISGGLRRDELCLASIALAGIMISNGISPLSGSENNCLAPLGVQKVRFLDKRILVDGKYGSISDRINFGPGELRIHLSANLTVHEVTVLREPQKDLTVAISESQVPKNVPQAIKELLDTISTSQTIRKYQFSTLKDQHHFIAALTGFDVLFDGVVSSFAISRRRMVMPIYKKWEADLAHLQIISNEKVIQLVAFFENFSHGECMNFVLKAQDTFESFTKGGKFCIRIADAKFALPTPSDDPSIGKRFLCLDMPPYPSEHDDITISFDMEADRDQFGEALPAMIKQVSRLGTTKR